MKHPYVVAITGASGVVYAQRLLEALIQAKHHVHVTISASGKTVLKQELGIDISLDTFTAQSLRLQVSPDQLDQITYHHISDYYAPIASGSFLTAGMVICPCSGRTLSAVAHGAGSNLIQRAADVHLKEHRKLILVPRETPLSSIQLDNMKRVCEAGAVMLPAMPAWYHHVRTLDDLINFVVARILDQLGVEHTLVSRWGDDTGEQARE